MEKWVNFMASITSSLIILTTVNERCTVDLQKSVLGVLVDPLLTSKTCRLVQMEIINFVDNNLNLARVI